MLDHVSLGVTDLKRSRRFYDGALRPLGIVRILDFSGRGSDYAPIACSQPSWCRRFRSSIVITRHVVEPPEAAYYSRSCAGRGLPLLRFAGVLHVVRF
jgi:hypothetical protein